MNIHILEVIYETNPPQTVFAATDAGLFISTVRDIHLLNNTRPAGWFDKLCQEAGHFFHPDIKDFRTYSVERLAVPLALSPREMQVAEEIAMGSRTSEIAALLKLKPKTVSTYRERIKKKLGVRSSAEIAIAVRERGG